MPADTKNQTKIYGDAGENKSNVSQSDCSGKYQTQEEDSAYKDQWKVLWYNSAYITDEFLHGARVSGYCNNRKRANGSTTYRLC